MDNFFCSRMLHFLCDHLRFVQGQSYHSIFTISVVGQKPLECFFHNSRAHDIFLTPLPRPAILRASALRLTRRKLIAHKSILPEPAKCLVKALRHQPRVHSSMSGSHQRSLSLKAPPRPGNFRNRTKALQHDYIRRTLSGMVAISMQECLLMVRDSISCQN